MGGHGTTMTALYSVGGSSNEVKRYTYGFDGFACNHLCVFVVDLINGEIHLISEHIIESCINKKHKIYFGKKNI